MLKRQYGISYEQLQEMIKDQGYKCAICGVEITTSSPIDHCHETKKVRGVLCQHCNIGLGQFRDNVKYLDQAKAYLLANG